MQWTPTAGKLAAAAILFAAGCGTSEAMDGSTTQETSTATGTDTTGSTATESTTSTTSSTQPADRCDERAGRVTSYYPRGERDFCRPLVFEQRDTPLFSGDRLSTDSIGSLTFETELLTRCDLGSDADVLVRPETGIEIRLLRGTVGCYVEPGADRIQLEFPGGRTEISGTLFILTAVGETTTIKAYDGSLLVRATDDPSAAPVQLSGGRQAVAARGRPLRGTTYTPGRAETALIDRLRLGILTFPPDAISDVTQGSTATEGTLVTETEEQARTLDTLELVPALDPITTSTIRRRSGQVFVDGARLVVGVGSFEDLVGAFERLRRELGPEATLVFSPYAFPGSRTTPTTSTTTATVTTTTTPGTPSDPATTSAPTTTAAAPP
jgi:hypothetical protein